MCKILSGNLSWLRECLDNRVGVNGLDKAGSTALYWACHGGHKGTESFWFMILCCSESPLPKETTFHDKSSAAKALFLEIAEPRWWGVAGEPHCADS